MVNAQGAASQGVIKPPSVKQGQRKRTTWTPDTCPTPRGSTPRHAVGRPKGTKDRYPRGARKDAPALPKDTIAGLFRYIGQHEPELYYNAIARGLAAGGAKSFPFVSLGAAYMDGKPIERIMIAADSRLLFVTQTGAPGPAVPQLGGPDDGEDP